MDGVLSINEPVRRRHLAAVSDRPEALRYTVHASLRSNDAQGGVNYRWNTAWGWAELVFCCDEVAVVLWKGDDAIEGPVGPGTTAGYHGIDTQRGREQSG